MSKHMRERDRIRKLLFLLTRINQRRKLKSCVIVELSGVRICDEVLCLCWNDLESEQEECFCNSEYR